jgi:hypothetical protein
VAQLRQYEKQFDTAAVDIKVVTFDNDFLSEAYVRETEMKWPLLLDESKAVYSAYGMTRGSLWDLYNPISIAKYLGLMFRGRSPGKPGSDWHQLGGDVVIDPEQIVRMHFVSDNPHRRPDVESILGLIGLPIQ